MNVALCRLQVIAIMGQGYSVIHPSAGGAGLESPEVSDLTYEKGLNGARFLKIIRARHKDGVVIVKIYTKPYVTLKLDDRIRQLVHERQQLADVPNALAYHRIVENNTNAYLIRQYVHSSLYDRISTNPPLEDIERKWIAFQLLCAVRDCHAKNIYHGDIKTENILVTSWNWLYLTDFAASIKPHYLPEDNPVDFSLFYDTTTRRTCYLAPERFTTGSQSANTQPQGLQWTMDIFSVGCVIAELFTEKPTFTLSQLFRYRRGEFDPATALLASIKDDKIREMVLHMIKLDPSDRYSAQEYLDFWKDKAFPAYFYTFLHQYIYSITDTSSAQSLSEGDINHDRSDHRIDRIYNDYDKIAYALGFQHADSDFSSQAIPNTYNIHLYPLQIDIPNNRHTAMNRIELISDNSALLFTNIVIASLRSTARSTTRVRSAELLLTFGEHLTDEAKLDRVLPYAMLLLEDEEPFVRIVALRCITQSLLLVTVLSPMNAFIFPRYILPRLSKLVASSVFAENAPLRATYAACLSGLAITASRFLDLTQALRADGALPSIDPEAENDIAAYAAYQLSYDVTREELVNHFQAHTKTLLTDSDASVRRAFLGSVGGLCVFFGETLTADLILTHLNTYLNDNDWTLRCALCETIVGVAAFVGSNTVEEFILPLLIQALTDSEETVTEQVLRALNSIIKLGLLQKWTLLEVMLIVARFTMHPSYWIREATAQLIDGGGAVLQPVEYRSLLEPILRPYLKVEINDTTELVLLDCLRKPITRSILDLAKAWAARSDETGFWKSARISNNHALDVVPSSQLLDVYRGTYSQIPKLKYGKDDTDSQWLTRLHSAGFKGEDEGQLLALRDYIWRVVARTDQSASSESISMFAHVVSLTSLKVALQNVLFDEDLQYYDQIAGNRANRQKLNPSLKEISRQVTPKISVNDFSSPKLANLESAGKSKMLPLTKPITFTQAQRTTLGSEDTVNVTTPGSVLSSSPGSLQSVGNRQKHAIRHRDNAIHLMKPNDVTKATAEVSTADATALGTVNVSGHHAASPITSVPITSPLHGKGRSYEGTDPTLNAFLNTYYTSAFAIDVAEFGPKLQPLKRARPSDVNPGSERWKPEGLLVANMTEHGSRITCIAVASDHAFFLTGSTDGTVRIWDTSRLERNLSHRSRQVHRHQTSQAITALCFVESTHSFISCAADGSLNVTKIDTSQPKSMKLHLVREWNVGASQDEVTLDRSNESKEHAIQIDHMRIDGQSICLILTSACRFIALDLAQIEVLYSFINPVAHGSCLCFCVNKRRQWLLIGTSHGIIDLWDLRFRIKLRSWTFKSPKAITRLAVHPGKRTSHRMRVIVAGGSASNHVSIWDIEKLTCHEVYNVDDCIESPKKMLARDLELIPINDEQTEVQLDRFGTNISMASFGSPQPVTPQLNMDTENSARAVNQYSQEQILHGSIKDFVIQMHVPSDEQTSVTEARQHFLITAGPDWKTRFWDPDRLEGCTLINSGSIRPYSQGIDEDPMKVTVSVVGSNTKIYTSIDSLSNGSNAALVDEQQMRKESTARGTSRVTNHSGIKNDGPSAKQPRYEIIRNSAQHLLNGHRDEITCIALLEKPFNIVITGDRSGGLYLFQ